MENDDYSFEGEVTKSQLASVFLTSMIHMRSTLTAILLAQTQILAHLTSEDPDITMATYLKVVEESNKKQLADLEKPVPDGAQK
jgi:hypothetical protein